MEHPADIGRPALLWHSVAPWAPSGYGQQTATFVTRAHRDGWDTAISAYAGITAGNLKWNGIPVQPARGPFGWDGLQRNLSMFIDGRRNRTAVFILTDAWGFMNADFSDFPPVLIWTPVDHDPPPRNVIETFRRTGATPVAMSKFGYRRLGEAGLDPVYAPHGIDTSIFKRTTTMPSAHGQRSARQVLSLPEDAFVVGIAAVNTEQRTPRKCLAENITAAAKLLERHPDAFLFLHTNIDGTLDRGVDLRPLLHDLAIPEHRVRCTDQAAYEIGIAPPMLAATYSSFDVLLAASAGEGFGIPVIEAQSCGVPVIVSDFTAQPELARTGWTVGGQRRWDPIEGSWFITPAVEELVEALELAYQGGPADHEEVRAKVRDYDADIVWKSQLEPILHDALGIAGKV